MAITLNGTTGITNDGGYTGDGVSFADTTPANTLVTTTGGNVGIGTSSPTQKLHVNGTARIGDTEISASSIEVGTAGSGDRASLLDFHSSGAPGALDYSTRILRSAGVNGQVDFINTGSGNFDFYHNTASRKFRIDNDGIQVEGAGASYPSSTSIFGHGSNRIAFGWTSPNIFGYVDNVVSAVVGTVSDYRLKANDQPLTDGLTTVLALRPITYNPVSFDGAVDTDKVELGLIAHEVQAIRPSVVTGEKDALNDEGNPRYQSVNYAGLVPDLIKAIQEQQAIITDLKARIEALEAK
jgi:hypothetical protein